MTSTTDLDPERTLSDLRELATLTSDEHGAQRVAWTPRWRRTRAWLTEKAAGLPVEEAIDAAGNQWFTLPGARPQALVLGSHLDSVPNGGWLDGALGVLAGLEVLRRIAAQGTPPVTVRLVNWADEEGARFGRSLFGSSAASGTLDIEEARLGRDAQGVTVEDALRENGVELDRMKAAGAQLADVAAYLELHIEQGPVLERLDLPLGVVTGTFGVERRLLRFTGQSAHAGSTPMDQRRDPLAAAARTLLEVREIARREGGVGTVGRLVTSPGIVTAIAGEVEMTLDLRHLDAPALGRMLEQVLAAADRVAGEEGVRFEVAPTWHIDPILFDPTLLDFADTAVAALQGRTQRLPSGPLHDAAEMARIGIPTAMLFTQSLRGLSHTKEEDSRPEHVRQAVTALDGVASRTLRWLAEPGHTRSEHRR
ncbi:MAG: Zn-dependent hydrolase [Candidatus Dormiibacterota bacterium]